MIRLMATWKKAEITLQNGSKAEASLPIIVSASRSTDIPAFYSDWLISRLNAGYVKWINPFNNRPSYVSFDATRLIVFWSKNPKSIIQHLSKLDKRKINYYFQFTLNDYNSVLEPNVPSLESRIETFKELSQRLGKDRVIWRFDPLMVTDTMSATDLLEKVEKLGDRIAPFTSQLVFSFIDINAYSRVKKSMSIGTNNAIEPSKDDIELISSKIGSLCKGWGISARTCGEVVDLEKHGIEHNRCIDDRLMVKCFSHDKTLMDFIGATWYDPVLFPEKAGWQLESYNKDAGQRQACGCIMSKDIGEYCTCPHLCKYCYANSSKEQVLANWKLHCQNKIAETITGR